MEAPETDLAIIMKEISKWFAISSKIATNVDTKICQQQRKETTRVRFTSFSAPTW